jgi:hypothetical protein
MPLHPDEEQEGCHGPLPLIRRRTITLAVLAREPDVLSRNKLARPRQLALVVIASFAPTCGRPALHEKGHSAPNCGEKVSFFLVSEAKQSRCRRFCDNEIAAAPVVGLQPTDLIRGASQ